jgi:hypothetical protein
VQPSYWTALAVGPQINLQGRRLIGGNMPAKKPAKKAAKKAVKKTKK